MKIFNSLMSCLIGVALMMPLASCETNSSVEYTIYNMTNDTVTVQFLKALMTSPYQGYDIEENDSVTTHYSDDSCNIALLAPSRRLMIKREWQGLYREERIVHAWRYISSIKIGEVVTDSTTWNNESAWHHRSKGGGNFAKEESHYYDLWVQ